METPSIWLDNPNQILGLWMGFRVPSLFWVPFEGKDLESFGNEERKGWDFESHPLCVWWDAKQPTTTTSGSSHLHLFERNHVHISVVLFASVSLSSVSVRRFLEFRVSLQSDVRICCPSLGSEREREKVGLTASHISAIGPTRLSSRRDRCYLTREDKHGDRPSENFEFHWWGARSRDTSSRNARPLDASRRIRISVPRGTTFWV